MSDETKKQPSEPVIESSTLLGCPFCGSNARFCAYPDNPTFMWVGCDNCEIRTDGYNFSYGDESQAKKHLVAVWNNRQEDKPNRGIDVKYPPLKTKEGK